MEIIYKSVCMDVVWGGVEDVGGERGSPWDVVVGLLLGGRA